MRLTLRTLLSYLDDTLDPAQTKIIGAKVADSEQARDLTERIKQVTRRRRLTTPPTTGPGGIDANTIAEYLDNDVTPEKSAEVEQICLASDVHLAEVAACHQILTLVLGEPALVPPSAKQRMYGLVKGPEAIPFRRAARNAKNDNDLSSEIEPDHDDSLRLGVPSVAGGKDQRNLILLAGGGVLAACFLGFAIYMLLGPGRGGNVVEPKKDGGEQIVQNDGKNKDQAEPKDDDKKKTSDGKEKKEVLGPPPKKETEEPKQGEIVATRPDPAKPDAPPPPVEIAYTAASTKQAPVGQLVPPGKTPAVLLQMKSKDAGWTRFAEKDVISSRPLLSLPGSKNVIALKSGVELTLWGNVVEQIAESRAILHAASDPFDADVTLQRGRIVLRNHKKGNQDALVRVRFNNPNAMELLGEENHFDITVHGDSAVLLERFSVMQLNEPFYDDPKDPLREGPTAKIWVYAYGGSANVRSGQVSYGLGEAQNPILEWVSRVGVLGPADPKKVPPAPPAESPPFKDKAQQQGRERVVKAHADLVALLEKKEIDVALAELLQAVQKSAERELATSKQQQLSPDTYLRWLYIIRCYAAIDDVDFLFREFIADPTPAMIRFVYMNTLQQWLALGRENDYQMLQAVQKSYRSKTTALNIMHLFHLPTTEDALKPATYEHLIENLNNSEMPIRALSHLHLLVMVPDGQKIAYDPADPPQLRLKAMRAWSALVPPGKLPPGMAPMKKDKDKN